MPTPGNGRERDADDKGEMEKAMTEEQIADFKPKSLDDLLTTDQQDSPAEDKADPAPADTDSPADPPEKAEAQGADVEGDGKPEESKGEPEKAKEDAPPASDQKDIAQSVPLKALQAERIKRQELASQVGALQQQINAKARPDPLEDPEGTAEFDRKESDDRSFSMRCEMSQEMMREIHEDYDEFEGIFMESSQSNPALAAQLAQHPFPAKFAYAEGKRLAQLNEMGGDPVAYVERKMKEAAKAGADAAIAEIQKQQAGKLKSSVPESLAEAPSAPLKEVKKWSGPKSIDEILNG